jgi:poly(A) polymerase
MGIVGNFMAEGLGVRVVRRLQAAGFAAYFAGGCVRDWVMGREPKDVDVATSAVPAEVAGLFARSQMVGAAFGVVLVKEKKEQVEVATFRADGTYTDGRHPDAVRFTTAEEDARRRDFTCNGLFFDPVARVLHDFVGGQKDIEGKVLRAIGEAAARFGEDHLRMLRAVRFAARLGFEIEAGTRAAMGELQGKIAGISRERIGEEVRMMLEHPTCAAAMEILAGFGGMFREVMGFEFPEGCGFAVLSNLPAGGVKRFVALMALVRDAGVEAGAAVRGLRGRLMLSNEETEALAWLAEKWPVVEGWEALSKAATKRLMAEKHWPALEMLWRADPVNGEEVLAFSERVESLREEGVAPAPYVTGEVLIRLGARPGREFKGWLEALYDRQLEGEFATKEEAESAARVLVGG